MDTIQFIPKYERIDQEVLSRLSQIEAYRKSVQRLPVPPKLAEYFNRLIVARTVHGTVAIEGSSLTEEEARDLIEAQNGKPNIPGREREISEAMGAQRAHDYVRSRWGQRVRVQITEEDICHIHRLLTQEIPYQHNIPGEYRHHAVHVGSQRHGGIYRPPDSHEKIKGLMKQFIDWLTRERTIASLPGPILAILAHYFFVLIHPFGDGNGRTARALESLILYQGGYNIKGFYSLSNYYYRNRDEYFTLLQLTRTELHGDQTKLLQFSLKGLDEELQYIQDLIVDRLKVTMFQDYINELVSRKELNHRQGAILHFLSSNPEGLPWEVCRTKSHPLIGGLYQNLTHNTLVRDLERMIKKGVARWLKPEKGKYIITANISIMDSFI